MSQLTCFECGSAIPGSVGVCTRCTRPTSSTFMAEPDPVMYQLEMYIGDRWYSHYRPVFERLLREERTGYNAGWTWNWAAALAPFWFFYRGLYREWLMLFLPAILLGMVGLGPLTILMYGYYGDRMLFNRAMSEIGRSTLPARQNDPLPIWFWVAVMAGTLWTLALAAGVGGGM